MTKKSTWGLWVAFAAVAALVVAGCNNTLVQGSVSGTGATENVLTITATNIPTDYLAWEQKAKMGPSRSIYAEEGERYTLASDADNGGVTWILSGKAPNGQTFDDKEVSLIGSGGYTAKLKESDGNGSTKDVTLSAYTWELTLTAYIDYGTEKNHSKPVLQGTTSVDLRNGSAGATFNMSTTGLTTPGTVQLAGTFKPSKIIKSYDIGIYNAYTMELIEKYTVGDTESDTNALSEIELTGDQTNSEDAIALAYGRAKDATTGTEVKLNAGAYTLLIKFYNGKKTDVDDDGNPTRKVVGAYMDTIIIEPGVHVNKDLGEITSLSPAPAKPSKLMAFYKTGSEDAEGGYYDLLLKWTAAEYATNYEIQLTEYTLDDDRNFEEGTPVIYGLKAIDPQCNQDFAGADIRRDGSILAGNTQATLRLELGKLYEVQIRSANYVTQSDWTARSTPATGDAVTGYEGAKFSEDGVNKIHRNRIVYKLNGGDLYLKADDATPVTNTYTQYNTWVKADTDPALLVASATAKAQATAQKPYLVHGSAKWAAWLDATDQTTEKTTYSYTNMTVIASYGDAIDATVNLTKYEDIDKADVKVIYGKADATGAVATATKEYTAPNLKSTLDIAKWIQDESAGTATASTIVVTLAGATGSEREYSDIKCTLVTFNSQYNTVEYVADSDGKCTISTANLDTQNMELLITAKNKAGRPVSAVYTIALK